MNKARWMECKSAARLTIKLAEEVGEVAKAHLDVLDATSAQSRDHRKRQLVTEIGHVQFISQCLLDLVLADEGSELRNL